MEPIVQERPQNLHDASRLTGSFHLEEPHLGHVLGRSAERMFQ